MSDRWPGEVWAGLLEVRERLLAVIPGLLVMLTLLALGLVTAWVARLAVSRLGRVLGVDRAFERWGVSPSLRRSGILRPTSDVLGLVCFWAIFILFASAAVDALARPGQPVATALTHVGIGKEMVLVAFGITFGGVVFALALAFGLGGRAIARHILERRLRRESPPPQERITQL